MNLRFLMGAPALAAMALFPSSAPAAGLIAPLDVRVTAEAKPSSVLQGAWNVYPTVDGGSWRGENIKLVEIWQRAASKRVRVRGRASGGPRRIHYVEVNYLTIRTGEGVLTEVRPPGESGPPLELHCRAQGADGPGDSVIRTGTTMMQIVDQPARNRVIVRGPGITFLGPYCQRPGHELPYRGVGIHPPRADRPWIPRGARSSWELRIPRAEFAAGGTFRFRGSYSLAANIQDFSSTSDVFGTALTHGKVAVDLNVRRVGR
jgi:hypothetical protein